MSDGFYRTVEKLLITLMVCAFAAYGIGYGVRQGTDPMREEFAKFREMATKLLDNHEQRITNVEQLYMPK